MTMTKADAFPRKRFFLEMFTRDISLEDCLLDLVDNAIDSFLRLRADAKVDIIGRLLDPKAPRGKEPLPEVSLIARPGDVSIVDNCGGIPRERALREVFCFGHAQGEAAGRLGVYGIGLKRALFKIGNAFEMESHTLQDGFRVAMDVNAWAQKDGDFEDWHIPITLTKRGRPSQGGGTSIHFTSIRAEVQSRLKDGSLEASLQQNIAQAYAFLLEKYVRVKLNNKIVNPMPVPIARDSAEIAPARHVDRRDGVTMQFVAGLIPPGKERRAERSGWYVLCNGRVVLAADKSEVTGWGRLRNPAFHTKFNAFIGVALLESKDALSLPWTTTKRGLNKESPIYQAALANMVSISKPIIGFLSRMYPSEPEASLPEREAAGRIIQGDLIEIAQKSNRAFQAKLKKPGKTTISVQYSALKAELDKIRKHKRDPKLSASDIGRLTLDYYLDVECDE